MDFGSGPGFFHPGSGVKKTPDPGSAALDTSKRYREKSSDQTYLFNRGTTEAMDRTTGQAQNK